MPQTTQPLDAATAGDSKAAAELEYAELGTLAVARLANEKPGQTLQATALAHEAYLRLVREEDGQFSNGRGHFFGVAA